MTLTTGLVQCNLCNLERMQSLNEVILKDALNIPLVNLNLYM